MKTRAITSLPVTFWVTLLIAGSVTLILSCKPDTQVNPVGHEADVGKQRSFSLERQLSAWRPVPQEFGISAKIPGEVVGKRGTRIWVDARDLETTSGDSARGDILVQLIELVSAGEMALYGLQTHVDGELVSAGGAFWIRLSSNGEELVHRPGKNLRVSLPGNGGSDMELFYSESDSGGVLNCYPSGISLIADTDSPVPDKGTGVSMDSTSGHYRQVVSRLRHLRDSLNGQPMTSHFPADMKDSLALIDGLRMRTGFGQGMYESIEIEQLGWIFPISWIPEKSTDVSLRVQSGVPLVQTYGWLIFPEQNAISGPLNFGNGTSPLAELLPIGQPVKAIFYGFSADRKMFLAQASLRVQENSSISVEMKEVTDAEVRARLSQPLAL